MLTARYWREKGQRYRLEAAKCTQCGKIAFPPRLVCPKCSNRKFETTRLADTGKIITYTVIRVPTAEFSDLAPYALAIVELDQGARLTCQVADCSFDDLAVGKAIRIEFRKIKGEGEAGLHCYGYKAVLA